VLSSNPRQIRACFHHRTTRRAPSPPIAQPYVPRGAWMRREASWPERRAAVGSAGPRQAGATDSQPAAARRTCSWISAYSLRFFRACSPFHDSILSSCSVVSGGLRTGNNNLQKPVPLHLRTWYVPALACLPPNTYRRVSSYSFQPACMPLFFLLVGGQRLDSRRRLDQALSQGISSVDS